jgi:adenosylcobinamide-phosphate synthase
MWAMTTNRRAMLAAHVTGLIAGFAADAVLGDPRRFHPVAGFGRAAGYLERHTYAPTRAAGARFTAVAVGVPVAAAIAAQVATRRRPIARAALTAATTWAVLGGTSLRREARAMAADLDRLVSAEDRSRVPAGAGRDAVADRGVADRGIADRGEAGDREIALADARARVPNLCGRDPQQLDAAEIGRATVESVAENTSDAVVAPLFWGAVAGVPGLVGYRAVNTLDAMVGHLSERYRDFGTASARLDDVANYVPSRITAVLTIGAAAAVPDGRPATDPRHRTRKRAAFATFATWLRDRNRHPSPNAGQCEAAMAGALGVRLGGRNVYRGRVEVRPMLGRGPLPGPREVRRAGRISEVVGLGALATFVLGRTIRSAVRTRATAASVNRRSTAASVNRRSTAASVNRRSTAARRAR